MPNPTTTQKEYDIQWQQQHDIRWFELNYEKLIPGITGLTDSQKKLIDYRIQGTLFIGRDFYALVVVSMRHRDPKILINPCPSRIFLINMSQKQIADYIYYDDRTINFDGRILELHAIDIYKIDSPRMTEYTIYGITDSAKFHKLREFKLPTDTSTHSLSDNTFIYIDPQNYLQGFKYNPNTNSQIDLSLVRISDLIPDLDTRLFPLLINSFSDTNKYLVLEYSKYEDNQDDEQQPRFLIDMTVWPPEFKCKYIKAEIDLSFGRYRINNYIGRDHKPANILTVFPELFIGMHEEDIPEYVLDFQLVQLPARGEPDGIRHTYEIAILDKRLEANMLPPSIGLICKYCINPVLPGGARFKIINTYLGQGIIDGGRIFSAVEQEYRETLTRFQVSKSLFTKEDLSVFIHPFGRIIYSQTGKDGLIELQNNMSRYKNIIKGYYIFVVLPSTTPTNGNCDKSSQQPGFRLKIIGYIPIQIGGIKKCQETEEEFVYSSKYYDKDRTDIARLTAFYSTYVRRIESRISKAQLGLPEHLTTNISSFYVANRYLYDIRRINQQNNLVPLLGL